MTPDLLRLPQMSLLVNDKQSEFLSQAQFKALVARERCLRSYQIQAIRLVNAVEQFLM
jgi:hypothetical protein